MQHQASRIAWEAGYDLFRASSTASIRDGEPMKRFFRDLFDLLLFASRHGSNSRSYVLADVEAEVAAAGRETNAPVIAGAQMMSPSTRRGCRRAGRNTGSAICKTHDPSAGVGSATRKAIYA